MDFDDYAPDYAAAVDRTIAFSGQDSGFFARLKAKAILDRVGARLGAPGRLGALDIGCGVGLLTGMVAGDFGRMAGTDPSARSIEVAGTRLPAVEFRHSAGGELPFADASFDVAFATCVFHHVPPPERPALASEMFRVLRPGGLAMVFEHNPWNPLTRYVVSRSPLDVDAVLLAPPETAGLLGGAGGAEVEVRYIGFIPVEAGWARRVEGLLARLPLGSQYQVEALKPAR